MYCFDCQYDLSGNAQSGVCPECGRAFDVNDVFSYTISDEDRIKILRQRGDETAALKLYLKSVLICFVLIGSGALILWILYQMSWACWVEDAAFSIVGLPVYMVAYFSLCLIGGYILYTGLNQKLLCLFDDTADLKKMTRAIMLIIKLELTLGGIFIVWLILGLAKFLKVF